jgi:DtxR family Mn-dependent transcriptional regulator
MLSSSAEDYLEAVLILDLKKKVVRVKDISEEMGVSMPSVHQALKILKKEGMVRHESYGYVELTSRGRSEANRIYYRHRIIRKFLTDILNIPRRVAEEEACRIEHYISAETQRKLSEFIKTVESCPHSSKRRGGCGE